MLMILFLQIHKTCKFDVNSNDEINAEMNKSSVLLNANELSLSVEKYKNIKFHTPTRK